ncbi:hypothetical protein LEMLEM_LOCUS17400, partial [Lemmus lemmus]
MHLWGSLCCFHQKDSCGQGFQGGWIRGGQPCEITQIPRRKKYCRGSLNWAPDLHSPHLLLNH